MNTVHSVGTLNVANAESKYFAPPSLSNGQATTIPLLGDQGRPEHLNGPSPRRGESEPWF